jgi:D-amino-acid dehydrogenase
MRVAVVGGGVVGLCCAFALDERGFEVLVFEAGEVGSGASRGNTGWVVPTLATPLAAPGMLRTGLRSALDPRGALIIRPWGAGLDVSWLRWLWQFRRSAGRERFARGVRALLDLNRRTFEALDGYRAAGVRFEQHETGMLVVARDRTGLGWFETLYDELVRLGFDGDIEPLDAGAATAVEPALGDGVGAALRTTVDRYVRPETLTGGLADYLEGRRGTAVRAGARVDALMREGDGWLIATGTDTERVDAVVLATGVAANELLRPFGFRVPVIGAKGYSVTVPGTGRAPQLALYLSEAKIGVSPYGDVVRIAGLFELPARSAAVEPGRARQLVEETLPYLRDWRPAPGQELAGAWAGLRPATPDSLPLIGQVRGCPGLILAAGHGMLGITLAPATGLAVADVVAGETPDWLAPFRPDRAI